MIVTNFRRAHAKRLVASLKASFEVMITAEEMGVYKPRLRAFERTLSSRRRGSETSASTRCSASARPGRTG